MARLAAEQKLCYYPAHPLAIEQLAKHLRPRGPDPEKKYDTICALDPCAGEGKAIRQLTDLLGIDEDHVYTVELDPDRGQAIKDLIPGGHHIGPATFLGCQITGFSFGLTYVNPPFSDELGGGRREEQAFVERVTPLLAVKGILVLVCPLKALAGKKRFVEYLDANHEEIRVYRFPDGEDDHGNKIRPYNEIVVIGRKRKETLPHDSLRNGTLHQMSFQWRDNYCMEDLPELGGMQPVSWRDGHASYDLDTKAKVWEIPHSWRPNTYKKNSHTDAELDEAIKSSPLNKHFAELLPVAVAQPPLSLDKGHLGMILASGVLDGVVHGPHGTHIVRGSSYKKQYLDHQATESTMNIETGAVTTKEIYRERMITCIRALVDYPTPQILTFSNDVKEEETTHEEGDEDL
jgi:hypothetical protein